LKLNVLPWLLAHRYGGGGGVMEEEQAEEKERQYKPQREAQLHNTKLVLFY
jgi:hypothetical protein